MKITLWPYVAKIIKCLATYIFFVFDILVCSQHIKSALSMHGQYFGQTLAKISMVRQLICVIFHQGISKRYDKVFSSTLLQLNEQDHSHIRSVI